jgi:hypothetical protein
MDTLPGTIERLLLISPEQPRQKAHDALHRFLGGDPQMLIWRFELARDDAQTCLTFGDRLAALNALLDRMGV